jgi:MFS transporter, OFA family, oxalate/formate antiporter
VINRWWRVLGAVLVNLAFGSLAAWSVFVAPLEKELRWTRAQTSWVFPIAIAAFAASLIVAGYLQDKFGPFRISLTGAILLGAGFLLASCIGGLVSLYLILGVVVGLANGFGCATPVVVLAKWFADRRGLVIGLAVAGYGAGSVLVALAVPPLQASAGWRGAFLWLGAGYFVVAAAGALLLKNPPAVAAAARECTPGEMARTKQFPRMWMAACVGGAGGLMAISQLAPYAKSRGLAVSATLTLIVAAIGNAAGRIAGGALSDKFGRLAMLRAAMMVTVVAIVALPHVTLIYSATFAIFCGHGALLSVLPATTADFFGTRRLGANHGWMSLASAAAAIAGPIAGTYIFRAHHHYTNAFDTAGLLSAAALFAMLQTHRPEEAPAPAAVLVPKGATP